MARECWPEQTYEWPEISLGLILGSGTITSPREIASHNEQQANRERRVRNSKGATRLIQIITTESAHMLWVLRCERVIREKRHTDNEIRSRWRSAINARLTDDKITTATKIKRDKNLTNLIKATWEPLLRKQGEIPENWLEDSEVLVGRRMQTTMRSKRS